MKSWVSVSSTWEIDLKDLLDVTLETNLHVPLPIWIHSHSPGVYFTKTGVSTFASAVFSNYIQLHSPNDHSWVKPCLATDHVIRRLIRFLLLQSGAGGRNGGGSASIVPWRLAITRVPPWTPSASVVVVVGRWSSGVRSSFSVVRSSRLVLVLDWLRFGLPPLLNQR